MLIEAVEAWDQRPRCYLHCAALHPAALHDGRVIQETTSMKLLKIAAALAVLALPVTSFSGSANAATASNSQAGANGHNKNMEKNVGMRSKTMRHHRKM